jgi:hypothetical protein
MSRPVAAILAVIVLAAGIAVGIGAGALASPASDPAAAIVTATPAATPAATASSGAPTPSAERPSTEPSIAPTPSVEPTPTPEPTPELVPAPLTGEPVTRAVASRPVVAVMIDDLYAARPQMGLSQADVVWHAPAEGGIPRYMALFQSQWPTRVGPVRSSRLYYVGWAAEWRSVYVHAGGSPQAISFLRSAQGQGKAVYNADWSRYLYRVTFRAAPHNLYSDAKNFKKIPRSVGAKAVKNQAPVWSFAPDAPLELRPKGGTIIVPYTWNRITYKYDRASNTYRRSVSVEGKQYDVGVKPKVRIAPKNVIVMKVSFVPIGDKKHRLDGHITGTGPAWISTNGITVKGTWKKKTFTSPTRFYGPDGKEVTLTIGQTFIQVVTRSTRITVKDGVVPSPTPSPTPTPTPSPTAGV